MATVQDIRWTESDESAAEWHRAQRVRGMRTLLSACGLWIAAALLARWAFEPFTPELRWDLVLWAPALIWVLPIAFDLAVQRRQRKPREWEITEDGVFVPRKQRLLMPWKQVDSFTFTDDGKVLCLHRKDGFAWRITLPADEPTRAVATAQLQRHLPQRPPLPKHSPVQRTEMMLGAIVAIAYLAGFVWVVHAQPEWARRHADALMWVGLLLGPGTLVALLLIGRRSLASLFILAGALNMLSLGIGTIVALYLALRHLMPQAA